MAVAPQRATAFLFAFGFFIKLHYNYKKIKMTNITKKIVGCWTANHDQQIYINSFVKCTDTLVLDADGKLYRQYKTTNYVFKNNGGKDEFNINITVIGKWELKGDILIFKDMAPRLDENNYSYTPGKEEKDIDNIAIQAAGKAKLECKIAEVLINRGIECRQGNNEKFPNCHVNVVGENLVMKWEGYTEEDKMNKCTEPTDLDRTREAMNLQDAIDAPESRLVNAIIEGDCDYLNNVTFYTPCETTNEDNEQSIAFCPLEIGEKKYIISFTDIHHLRSSDLNNCETWRPTLLSELATLREIFDGICLNPNKGHSTGIPSHMLNEIVNRTFKGLNNKKGE